MEHRCCPGSSDVPSWWLLPRAGRGSGLRGGLTGLTGQAGKPWRAPAGRAGMARAALAGPGLAVLQAEFAPPVACGPRPRAGRC